VYSTLSQKKDDDNEDEKEECLYLGLVDFFPKGFNIRYSRDTHFKRVNMVFLSTQTLSSKPLASGV
jgi:hypothetical protein